MRKLIVATLAAVSLLALVPSAASATNITGTLNFNGGSSNFYDPAFGGVPAGSGNSVSPNNVTVGAGVEFAYSDVANVDSANFTASSLVLSDNVLTNAAPWRQTFTADTAGFFNGASLGANNFTGLTWSVTNNTLTVDWGGAQTTGLRTANFSFSGGAVPEPATWATMILGLFGIGMALRRAKSMGQLA